MGGLIAKLPPKEQIFFLLALLFAGYLGVTTPTSSYEIEALTTAVAYDMEADPAFAGMRPESLVADMKKGIPQTLFPGAQRMREAFERRLDAVVMPQAFARESPFRPSSERYEKLPPASLPEIRVGNPPGFEPPTGLAPELEFQVRPRTLPSGRVRLTARIIEPPID